MKPLGVEVIPDPWGGGLVVGKRKFNANFKKNGSRRGPKNVWGALRPPYGIAREPPGTSW